MKSLASNFAHLQSHDEQLLRLGMLAERYFADDPNTCLLKLRQLSEILAQLVASNVGILDRPEDGQYELLSRLRDHGILPYEITTNSSANSSPKTPTTKWRARCWNDYSRPQRVLKRQKNARQVEPEHLLQNPDHLILP